MTQPRPSVAHAVCPGLSVFIEPVPPAEIRPRAAELGEGREDRSLWTLWHPPCRPSALETRQEVSPVSQACLVGVRP